jgi:hypothetical protein
MSSQFQETINPKEQTKITMCAINSAIDEHELHVMAPSEFAVSSEQPGSECYEYSTSESTHNCKQYWRQGCAPQASPEEQQT